MNCNARLLLLIVLFYFARVEIDLSESFTKDNLVFAFSFLEDKFLFNLKSQNSMPLKPSPDEKPLDEFLRGKSEHTLLLYHHFINEYKKLGKISVHPAKTMIGI